MSIFKKKGVKKELPSLPELPELPELPKFPELPKVPQEKEIPTLPSLPSLPSPSPKLLLEPEQIKVPVKPVTMEISDIEKKEFETEKIKEIKEQPIFVKIDKYRDAIANLEMIKKKIHETSNLLEKIKETRAKEEEELNIWAQEINTIKEKIEIIDKKLFSI
ncbi:MAG: hypothetical protein QW041_01670 [Candidatus Pacearchaeota archaeon]